jgi:molecular chaperone HscB
MTTCWSCGEAPGQSAFCQGCGKVQPPRGEDHFALLGLPRAFALEAAELERRYRDGQRKLHPDRFALKSAEERRASLSRATDLNEAYRTLQDPARRAAYLLALRGVALPTDGRRKTRPAEPEFLMEVLDLRESLDEAKREKDLARVEALALDVRARRDSTLGEIERALGGDTAGEAVLPMLDRLKYFTRFLDEVTAIEEAAAEAGR